MSDSHSRVLLIVRPKTFLCPVPLMPYSCWHQKNLMLEETDFRIIGPLSTADMGIVFSSVPLYFTIPYLRILHL